MTNEVKSNKVTFVLLGAIMLAMVVALVYVFRENVKNYETLKTMSDVAIKWDKTINPPETDGATDAWGGPIHAKVLTGLFNYELQITSDNTSSKVIVRTPHGKKLITKAIENGSNAVGKGLASGIKQGVMGK